MSAQRRAKDTESEEKSRKLGHLLALSLLTPRSDFRQLRLSWIVPNVLKGDGVFVRSPEVAASCPKAIVWPVSNKKVDENAQEGDISVRLRSLIDETLETPVWWKSCRES